MIVMHILVKMLGKEMGKNKKMKYKFIAKRYWNFKEDSLSKINEMVKGYKNIII